MLKKKCVKLFKNEIQCKNITIITGRKEEEDKTEIQRENLSHRL
jgi:hypothetical protein